MQNIKISEDLAERVLCALRVRSKELEKEMQRRERDIIDAAVAHRESLDEAVKNHTLTAEKWGENDKLILFLSNIIRSKHESTMDVEARRIALCEGRHEIPQAEHGYLFADGEIADVTDVKKLETLAIEKVDRLRPVGKKLTIDLYVTGLSVALVAAINACAALDVPLCLWHYNRDTGDYFPQVVKMEG